jgi:hypothetical protein
MPIMPVRLQALPGKIGQTPPYPTTGRPKARPGLPMPLKWKIMAINDKKTFRHKSVIIFTQSVWQTRAGF